MKKDDETAFNGVLAAYCEIKRERSAIVAIQLDRDPSASRSRVLTTTCIEFVCDVETATQRALKGDTALELVWWELAIGEEPANAKQAEDVIRRCGYLYAKNELMPERYFAVKKRGKK